LAFYRYWWRLVLPTVCQKRVGELLMVSEEVHCLVASGVARSVVALTMERQRALGVERLMSLAAVHSIAVAVGHSMTVVVERSRTLVAVPLLV
jgi:hypothetical protein